MAAVAANHHVSVLQADAGVDARNEVDVAGVAGETFELAGQPAPMSLVEAAGEADVLAGAVELAFFRRFASEFV